MIQICNNQTVAAESNLAQILITFVPFSSETLIESNLPFLVRNVFLYFLNWRSGVKMVTFDPESLSRSSSLLLCAVFGAWMMGHDGSVCWTCCRAWRGAEIGLTS